MTCPCGVMKNFNSENTPERGCVCMMAKSHTKLYKCNLRYLRGFNYNEQLKEGRYQNHLTYATSRRRTKYLVLIRDLYLCRPTHIHVPVVSLIISPILYYIDVYSHYAYGRPTLKDVSEQIWTRPFRELIAKSNQTTCTCMKSNEQNMSK